ncbi:MAG: hypothetical protein WDZ59_12000 [Pirellulales bacterium]
MMLPVVADLGEPSIEPLRAVATLVLAAAVLWQVVRGIRRVRGTTLVAPLWWCVFAVLCVVAARLAGEWFPQTTAEQWIEPLRYAAAASSLCPMMAVLGAKRPQDRGWQLIVLSLWIILLLPAGQWLLFRPGDRLLINQAWGWFLAVLLVFGLLNYLPTRHWGASLLAASGQLALLAPYLPLVPVHFGAHAESIALGLTLVAVFWVKWRSKTCGHAQRDVDRAWLEFRDLFGAVWALRVAQRMNASAEMYGWNVQLTWQGFAATEGEEPSEATLRELRRGLRSLLWRFIPPEWVDRWLSAADPEKENRTGT